MNGGDGRLCALQPTHCPEGTVFTTPRMLEQGGGGLAHGGACVTREGTEEVSKIGSCPEGCTSDASACIDPSTFVELDDRCTIRKNSLSSGNVDTLFGKCMADNACYWSRDDCSNPSTWTPAYSGTNSQNSESACTCENVRVGACLNQGFYYCAVSASSCSSTAEWINAPTLASRGDAPSCFLCNPQPTATSSSGAQPEVVPSLPESQPTQPGTNPVNQAIQKTSDKDSDASKVGMIVGLSIGGLVVVVCLLVITMFGMRRFVGRTDKPHLSSDQATSSDIPVETSTSSAVKIGDGEDLSDIED